MTTFAPKSIIIPATGSYPEHALRVLSDDGVTLTACAIGGGFVLSFGAEKRAHYGFRLLSEAEQAPKWREGRFYLDLGPEEESLRGWTTGHRWNGWACPYFDRETFQKALSAFGSYMTWSYDEATDTFTFQTEDDEQPSTERGRFNEELGLTLYSTDGWTWSEEQ